jgi:hypothetical protein
MNADLTLICGICIFPIGDGTGWLRVTFADIHKHREQRAEYDAYRRDSGEPATLSMLEMLIGPEPIHWRAYHAKCEPEADQDAYQIDSERICTWRQLAHWTAHLMEKNWFADTDWDCLLREVAGDSPAETIQVLERAS